MEELTKGNGNLSDVQLASKTIVDLVAGALDDMKKSTKEKPYRHDIIDLFYADCDTLDAKLYKLR